MWKRLCAAFLVFALVGGISSVVGCSGEKGEKKEISLSDTEG